MKPLFISTLLLFFSLSSVAQDYKDLIFTRSGEEISCTITLVNDQNIFYNHKPKNTEVSSHIAIADVEKYWT